MPSQDVMAIMEGLHGWMLFSLKEDCCGILKGVSKYVKGWSRMEGLSFILCKMKWDEMVVGKNWTLGKKN